MGMGRELTHLERRLGVHPDDATREAVAAQLKAFTDGGGIAPACDEVGHARSDVDPRTASMRALERLALWVAAMFVVAGALLRLRDAEDEPKYTG